MSDVLSRADIEAMAKKLEENNAPPFVCRGCGAGFYRWLGWGMVGAGWNPKATDPDLCEDCSGGAS